MTVEPWVVLVIVAAAWIAALFLLNDSVTATECDPMCGRCAIYRHIAICPLCFNRHEGKCP